MVRYTTETDISAADIRNVAASMRRAVAQLEAHAKTLDELNQEFVTTKLWDSAQTAASKMGRFAGALSEAMIAQEFPEKPRKKKR